MRAKRSATNLDALDRIRLGMFSTEPAETPVRPQLPAEPDHPWYGQVWNGVHYKEGVAPHAYRGTNCEGCLPPGGDSDHPEGDSDHPDAEIVELRSRWR